MDCSQLGGGAVAGTGGFKPPASRTLKSLFPPCICWEGTVAFFQLQNIAQCCIIIPFSPASRHLWNPAAPPPVPLNTITLVFRTLVPWSQRLTAAEATATSCESEIRAWKCRRFFFFPGTRVSQWWRWLLVGVPHCGAFTSCFWPRPPPPPPLRDPPNLSWTCVNWYADTSHGLPFLANALEWSEGQTRVVGWGQNGLVGCPRQEPIPRLIF